jgi:cytoskeletal protein CcmA (bactofilin family)
VRPFLNTAPITDTLWLADHCDRCLNATLSDDRSRLFQGRLPYLGDFMRTRSPAPATVGANGGIQHRTGPTDSGDKSIIGNDLRIIGQGLKIISRGILQIDGEIEGDVQAAEVIVGEQGKVSGLVAGQQVLVNGKVSGAICAKTVTLQAKSEVEGDLHHMALALERGALFEGRSRRAASEDDLNKVLAARTGEQKRPG